MVRPVSESTNEYIRRSKNALENVGFMKGLEQLLFCQPFCSSLLSKVTYTYKWSKKKVLIKTIQFFPYAHNFIIWCFEKSPSRKV